MKAFCILLIATFCASLSVEGKTPNRTVLKGDFEALKKDTTPTTLYKYYFSQPDSLSTDTLQSYHTSANPHYYRLFVPLAFYYAPIEQIHEIPWEFQPLDTLVDANVKLLPVSNERFASIDRINRQVNKVLLDTYMKHPEFVVTTEDQINSRQVFREDIGVKIPHRTSVLSLFKPDEIEEHPTVVDIEIRKPNFWTMGGNGSLQFSQHEVSNNWYKGGESSNSMLANLSLFSNYNDKEKVQFENLLEVKVGFTTMESDTMHKYKMNTDLFRLYSKLGIQAASKWYYTVSGEFNTQFFRNYKTNTDELQSAFMSPANLILSIGMDYKQKIKEKMNLSVFISPLAYNFRYVGNDKVDETKFGLDEGKKVLHDFGSKVQTTLSWKVIPSVVVDSRLYYFTNYEKVEAEWENTINFVLNRYLSTKLFVHARFDDAVNREDGHSYFQAFELLSFGINYKW